MNSRIVLPFLALTIVVRVYAQTPETVIARAFYDFSHQRDSTDENSVISERMVLNMGLSASMYMSHQMEQRLETAARAVKNPNAIPEAMPKAKIPNRYHYYKNEGKWIVSAFITANYAYDLPEKPVINWRLGSEIRSISGWLCQKATGSWKGRTYTAWFCPDLPFSFGPWKLHGLPGLILEAYDDKEHVKFLFAGYESYLLADKTTALPAYKLTLTTEEQFMKLFQAFNRNPLAYLRNATGIDISPIEQLRNNARSRATTSQKTYNNPIELTK